MRKILLTIQYNGKNFSGWQRQKNALSIEEVLENKISALLGQPIVLEASGRTDAGVHAYAQTAHFETSSNFDIEKLPQAINFGLDENISVVSAKEVAKNFHARFSVKKKTYLYKTYQSKFNLPLFESTHAKTHELLTQNFDKMVLASRHFLGTHNFRAFCSTQTNAKTFERTIFDIKLKKSNGTIDFFITGSGFLYNMVRIIVGTLISVGEGKILPEEIPDIISSQDRKKAGKTMPAHALYLYKVYY
ncbi:MAG: tRNA pseudouridine(38-40) synthase TruA [Clostridia bacterium]|nr:tRNA pseudouridine(38-40) synthase TruA [Clostridia bacterium]